MADDLRASGDLHSSGDLLADRRYAYAEAAFAEADWEVAADLAAQALELEPRFAAGWMLLGRAREAQFRADESGEPASAHFRDAVSAFEAAAAADPADRLGARIRLAQLGVADPLRAVSPGYVTTLFDDYAVRFDRHLRTSLRYRGPEVLHDAVRRVCSLRLRDPVFDRALDLGCGTGLAGELFRPECRTLVGIDLSPGMLRRAAAKRLYDALAASDLVAWLAAEPPGSADLALAADVLVYIGDLAPLLGALARVLRPGGLFALTVQEPGRAGSGDVVLGPDGRFAHGEGYLLDRARDADLSTLLSEEVSTRQDRGLDVPGRVVVLEKSGPAVRAVR